MRITKYVILALASLVHHNMKAQNFVSEPSSIKTSPLVAEIPALGSNYPYEHKVTRLSIPGQSIKESTEINPLIGGENYRELGNKSNKKAALEPNVLNSFKANIFNGYTPPDNTVAVSNSGFIVSSINSNVYYYNDEGQILGFTTFLKLSRDYFDELSGDLFDPRVIYDQENNRFIMVILNGHTAAESEVLIFFSKSDNPMDGWNAYAIDGDLDVANEWFDYPNISVNKNSLFISGNMFDVNDRFSKTVVLNIDKNKGFKGNDISYSHWSGLQNSLGKAFTVVPVEKGTRGKYSEKAFFVSTEGDFANIIVVYELDLSSGKLFGEEIEISYYDISNDSKMLNTTEALDMGDARVKNAILIDDIIHVVHTTTTVNKYAAVGYHRINAKSLEVESLILHKDNKKRNIAYPTVVSAGISSTDQTVFIAYTESGEDIYPQLNIVTVDENMEESNEVVAQEGKDFVDILSDNVERWGDYITFGKHFNSNVVWLFGCVGGTGEKHDNYLLQISLDKAASVPQKPSKGEIEVFPNPVTEFVNLEFEIGNRQLVNIGLYNAKGQLIATLTEDAFNAGVHLLHFDMSQLNKGIYFLNISGNEGIIAQKKLIK